jgi:polyisoprenoid-binding protein YceI
MSIATATTPLPTGAWSVDPTHSRVEFEASHLGIAPVRGAFEEFEGTLELGDDGAGARVYGSVSVASVDTSNSRRDAHLRSPAFFDAEQFPELTFESGEIRALDAETFAIAGRLTIHGLTRPITLIAEVKNAHGDERLALEVSGRLNRGDYSMTSFKVLVSDKVDLRLEISAVKQP